MRQSEAWPAVPVQEWVDTRETVHLWTQMMGKVKLALCPFVNQWWHVGLQLCAHGVTTGLIPADGRSFEIVLDLLEQRLRISVSDGSVRALELRPVTIAEFYAEFRAALNGLGLEAQIDPMPSELADPVAFDRDTAHLSYDAAAVVRWWQAMLSIERVLQRFRSDFTGKSSPVLLYWGGFDLNHTRFNGRAVNQAATTDPIRRFGENEENIAVGFWPGARSQADAVLYVYISPAPSGISQVSIEPPEAGFVEALGEFVLPYDCLRAADDPDATALTFFRSAYAACADRAGWARAALEGPAPKRAGPGPGPSADAADAS